MKLRVLSAAVLLAMGLCMSAHPPAAAEQKPVEGEIGQQLKQLYAAITRGEQPELSSLRRSIDELARRSPEADSLGMYEMLYAGLLRGQHPRLARAWLEYLSRDKHAAVAKLATGRLKLEGLRDQAMTMKFTAIDGREVDLEKLRGKVVLIDFWATWCTPCVAEQPHILAAYEKYRDKGFEVIGISMDFPNGRQTLTDFIARRKLPWPQHFDEENSQNRFADEYGIISIPTQLLLGPDGKLVHDEARGEKLDRELERLLGG